MTTTNTNRRFDAIVVGGNLSGLFAALQLRTLGFNTCVVESSPTWGGWDRSIVTPSGARFDMGFHVVDHERSFLATRLVQDLLGEDYRVHTLEREIVLAGTRLPYAAPPSEWPGRLQDLVRGCQPVDDIDDGAVTMAALERIYGKPFVEHVVADVVQSYPTQVALREQGVSDEQILLNIYPWFFPNLPRTGRRIGESSRYHQAMRDARAQHVIYPARGGFAAITEAIRARLAGLGVEMRAGVGPVTPKLAGVGPVTPKLAGSAPRLESLAIGGEQHAAHIYVWSAGIAPVFRLLGLALPPSVPVEFLLGSFELERELGRTPHEILVADPQLAINRLSFPARLVEGQRNHLLQTELAVPRQADVTSDQAWIERWTRDLRSLGLIAADNSVAAAQVMRLPLGECIPGTEAPAVAPILDRFDAEGSNLCLQSRSITPRNINQALPDTAARIAAFAAR